MELNPDNMEPLIRYKRFTKLRLRNLIAFSATAIIVLILMCIPIINTRIDYIKTNGNLGEIYSLNALPKSWEISGYIIIITFIAISFVSWINIRFRLREKDYAEYYLMATGYGIFLLITFLLEPLILRYLFMKFH